MNQRNKQSTSLPTAILLGTAVAIGTIIFTTVLTAVCIENEKIGENAAQQTVRLIIWAVSAFAGGAVTSRFGKQNKILMPLLTGAMLCAVLICVGFLFFEGSMTGLWMGVLMIGIGSVLSCLTALKKPKKKKYAYRR